MRVPLEILQLILREAVEILSYRDILRSRLVNRVFNEALWPTTAHLENKKSLFTSWHTFPYKRKYIWYLIEEHKERPCVFSHLIQDILDLPYIALLNEEEQHILIEKMIDAITRSREDPEVLFGLHRRRAYVGHMERPRHTYYPGKSLESVEEMLTMGLAASAIRRGDHMELEALLERGAQVGDWNGSLGMVPVDLAYKEGTREVIRTLVKHGCPLYYQNDSSWPYNTSCGLVVAARRGNQGVLEAWITLLLQAGKDLSRELREAVQGVLRIGKVEMVGVLEKYMNFSKWEMERLWLDCFNAAVKDGMLDVLRWLLRREGSSLAKRTDPQYKPALFIALHDCPSQIRPATVQLLLEHGFDPNGGPGVSQTPLQRAIENREVEVVILLLKWGADPNAVAKRSPPLHLATRQGSAPLVRLLLEHGARRSYRFKGKRYIVRQDTTVLENIARLLGELGMEEALIHEQPLEYFVLEQPRGK